MFKSNNKYIQCTNKNKNVIYYFYRTFSTQNTIFYLIINKNKYFYKLLIKIKDTSPIFYKKTLNRIVRKKKYESYIN